MQTYDLTLAALGTRLPLLAQLLASCGAYAYPDPLTARPYISRPPSARCCSSSRSLCMRVLAIRSTHDVYVILAFRV